MIKFCVLNVVTVNSAECKYKWEKTGFPCFAASILNEMIPQFTIFLIELSCCRHIPSSFSSVFPPFAKQQTHNIKNKSENYL